MALDQQQHAPAWAITLNDTYSMGKAHGFILHDNVADYIAGQPGYTLRKFLINSSSKRQIVCYWNRATGLTFASPEQAKLFAQIVELPLPGGAQAAGGIAGGLNAAAGSGAIDIPKLLEKVRAPGDALDLLNRLLHASTMIDPQTKRKVSMRATVIIDYTESIAPESATNSEQERTNVVLLSEWGRDAAIGDREHMIYMITNDLGGMHEQLRKSGMRWEKVAIPLPDRTERADFLQALLENRYKGEDEDMINVRPEASTSYQELARLTNGLRYIDLEDIIYIAHKQQVDLSRELVKECKRNIMKSESDEILDIVEPDHGFDAIGGMEEVKTYLREVVIGPMTNGPRRVVPQGILLMGPAGTGKTRIAKALAKESGATFINLNLSKIETKWHGESERNLARLFRTIQTTNPCFVFIDEIDQALRRDEGADNAPSRHVFKMIMELMSDTFWRGRIVWVAATNRPDLLDAALLRPGRFDVKVPVLATDAGQRAVVLEVLTKAAFPESKEQDFPTQAQYQELANQMDESYTGAEIEAILGKAVHLNLKGMNILDALTGAYERLLPSTQNIDRMTELALMYCNDLELIPERYRENARQLRHPAARARVLQEVEEDPTPHRRRREI